MDEKQIIEATREILNDFDREQLGQIAEKLRTIWLMGETKSTNLVKKSQKESQEHAGIAHDILKAIGNEIGKNVKKDYVAFKQLSTLLWNKYGREGRLVSVYILEKLVLINPDEIFSLCNYLAKSCVSWEDSDNLVYGIEPMVRKKPDIYLNVLKKWTIDENKWVKRVALTIIGRLPMKTPEYTKQCLEMVTPCLEENDLDIRRVNSFAIRLSARGNINAVYDYIKANISGSNGAKIWVFCDVIRSMTKSFLPQFKPLLPDYTAWLESVNDSKSKKSLEAAIKTLKSAE